MKNKNYELFIDLLGGVPGRVVRNERNMHCKMSHILFEAPGLCKCFHLSAARRVIVGLLILLFFLIIKERFKVLKMSFPYIEI